MKFVLAGQGAIEVKHPKVIARIPDVEVVSLMAAAPTAPAR